MQIEICCQKIVSNIVREFWDGDNHDTYITPIFTESTLSSTIYSTNAEYLFRWKISATIEN